VRGMCAYTMQADVRVRSNRSQVGVRSVWCMRGAAYAHTCGGVHREYIGSTGVEYRVMWSPLM
jgi:hypothetical protein